MLPLTDETRRKWLIMAAAICAVPTVLAPLAGRSAYRAGPNEAALDDSFKVLPVVIPRPAARVIMHRDPFVADRVASANNAQSSPRAASHATGDCARPVIRGVAIGARPQAILACGERIVLVGAGDRVGGAIVTDVSSSGVVLNSGVVLPLEEDSR